MIHRFKRTLEDQVAVYSKRDDELDAVYFRGSVSECSHCGLKRFKPYLPDLQEVEVTL